MLGRELRRTPTPQGALLELRLGPCDGEPVLILGHYDTVWPTGTAARRPPTLADGILSGPGDVRHARRHRGRASAHCRCSAQERLAAPVVFLLTPDEETGSMCSRERIVELGRAARCVSSSNPRSPAARLKTSRSGWAVYEIEVSRRLRATRVSSPSKRRQRDRRALRSCSSTCAASGTPALGTTLNAGVIAGGTLPNLVPRTRRRSSTSARARPPRSARLFDVRSPHSSHGAQGARSAPANCTRVRHGTLARHRVRLRARTHARVRPRPVASGRVTPAGRAMRTSSPASGFRSLTVSDPTEPAPTPGRAARRRLARRADRAARALLRIRRARHLDSPR